MLKEGLFDFDWKIFWDTTRLTDLTAGFPSDNSRIRCWLLPKISTKDIFLLLLCHFLRGFLPFVLGRGKNPENAGCFMGVKSFWNVGKFQKTGIYEQWRLVCSNSSMRQNWQLGCMLPGEFRWLRRKKYNCSFLATRPALAQLPRP